MTKEKIVLTLLAQGHQLDKALDLCEMFLYFTAGYRTEEDFNFNLLTDGQQIPNKY